MLKKRGLTFPLLSVLAACSSLKGAPEPVFPTDGEIKLLSEVYDDQAIKDIFANYRKSGQSEAERIRLRNELVLARMYSIDLRYRDFEVELTAESRQGNFALTLVSLGLSGAGAIVGASGVQTILAGVDTGLEGATQAFNRDILIDRTVQVLTTQMRAERDRLRAEIVSNLSQPTGAYPLPLALGQVEQYYVAGTLTGALTAVTETVSQSATEQNRIQSQAIADGIEVRTQRTTTSSDKIVNWFDSGDDNVADSPAVALARRNIAKAWFDSLNADRKQGLTGFSFLLAEAENHPDLIKDLTDFLNAEHGANITGG